MRQSSTFPKTDKIDKKQNEINKRKTMKNGIKIWMNMWINK